MTETPMTYDATPTAGVEKKRGTAWGMYTALFVLFLFNAATIAGGVWLWQQLSVSNHTAQATQQALTEQTEKSYERSRVLWKNKQKKRNCFAKK
jgi:uncharacterized protein HemX